jgi:tRNA threonylcarbamoyladenosine biosynthesis protein TsaB
MIVLGMDTATSATAVALRLADGVTTQARDDPPAGAHPGHATRLLAMAHDLLVAAGLGWSEVDRVAVGVGPGTFTGLRVGVATARGLAQSLSAELVGVSSTRALAHAALCSQAAEDAPRGVLAVIDARRGEVFAAAYEPGPAGPAAVAAMGSAKALAEGNGQVGPAGAPRELAAAQALAPERLLAVLEQAGNDGALDARDPGSWLAVGDGAVRYRDAVQAAGLQAPPDGSPLHRVSAAAICALGAPGAPAAPGEVVPDYRRRPDAELALDAAGAGGPA